MAESLWNYPDIIEKIADEIFRPLDDYPDEIFSEFFVERIREAQFVLSRISSMAKYGNNMLVIGDPGVGKTCFLNWLFKFDAFRKSDECYPAMIDLRAKGEDYDKNAFLSTVKNELIKILKNYIVEIYKNPCHDIDSPPYDNSEKQLWTYDELSERLIKHGKVEKTLFLFIDDIDYVDETCFSDLHLLLKPFLISKNCCVILAARNPAYNALIIHGDIISRRSFDPSTTLILSHLEASKVIAARVKTICSKSNKNLNAHIENAKNIWNHFPNLIIIVRSLYDTVAGKQVPIDLETIEHPFTAKQESFIQENSNGNVQYMLDIAKEYLIYMAKNRKKLKKEEQGYFIGREALLEHFSRAGVLGNIRIFDLIKRKSYMYFSQDEIKAKGVPYKKVGNSLHVILLEALSESEAIDTSRKRQLVEQYGFTENEINEGIRELKEMRMIEESRFLDRGSIGLQSGNVQKEYIITSRGRYYISYMIRWPQYLKKFGISTHNRIFQEEFSRQILKCSLMEFLIGIIVVREEGENGIKDFKISKVSFQNSFSNYNYDLLQRINPTQNHDDMVEIDLGLVTECLLELDLIKKYNLENNDNFLFYYDKTIDQKDKYNLPLRIVPPYFKNQILEFVEKSVRNPEYEEE